LFEATNVDDNPDRFQKPVRIKGKRALLSKTTASHTASRWRGQKLQLGTWPLDGGGKNHS